VIFLIVRKAAMETYINYPALAGSSS